MIYELWKQWHDCRPILLEELEVCVTHDEDDILVGLATGHLRLWGGEQSAIVTRFREEPKLKIAECLLVGGDMEEIRTMGLEIEAWAANQGCSLAVHIGRRGWTKVMDDYEDYGSVIAKEL